jgi:hypothetical protein
LIAPSGKVILNEIEGNNITNGKNIYYFHGVKQMSARALEFLILKNAENSRMGC